jgi:hypothetical protein
MAALELGVFELMAENTVARLTGLVEMIRGLANLKSEGARLEIHLHPQRCLKCGVRQRRRGGEDCEGARREIHFHPQPCLRCGVRKEGKDCDVRTGIIQFDVVRQECDIRCRLLAFMDTENGGEGDDSETGNS